MQLLSHHEGVSPDKPALVFEPSGHMITYGELSERTARLRRLLWRQGLRRGDHVAILMENHPRFLEICWAALKSGLYITAINRYLTPPEAGFILQDCSAAVLMTSAHMAETAAGAVAHAPGCKVRLMVDGVAEGFNSYEAALAATSPDAADEPVEDWAGDFMLYSSGSTGRPKGIKRPLQDCPIEDGWRLRPSQAKYGFGPKMAYLSPAPLYHSAPLSYVLGTHYFGGTAVVMERFEPADALALIERHRITHSQWVPTMFVRFLKMTEAERTAHDLSSHRCAVHSAAPCPVEVKRAMIEWWGPIIEEYFGATEGNGSTSITSAEWLERPGSVGRARAGIIHICGEDGEDLPPGEIGQIYFEQPTLVFRYHNDDAKTASAQHPRRPTWTSVGDIGYVDDQGYLFLTDRKSFMIISGGVNIYPQAIENALVLHPKVADVAVIGVPNPDFGEEVKAIVEPAAGVAGTPELAAELTAFLGGRIAKHTIPRSFDFMETLPRLPTGKLSKQALKANYWPATAR
ncbi:acyl-CoA synthetase [Phenylobacterium sp.]|uniref:acyl-CoA synthetase n=1 Tax=Phenylobacterium sp. TaxID=1871053 RepID=UPI00301B9326